MVLQEVSSPFVVLHSKLSGRGYDKHSGTLLRRELGLIQELYGRKHEGHSFTGTRLGST